MKRRIRLSISLVVSVVLASLMGSDSTATAQQQYRFSVDTGVVRLGQNQILRITVAAGDLEGDEAVRVGFKQIEYTQGVCSGGVCKLAVSSQTTSAPMTVAPGEALGFDHIGNFNFRGVVLSNRRSAQVHVMIIDGTTGAVVTSFQKHWEIIA